MYTMLVPRTQTHQPFLSTPKSSDFCPHAEVFFFLFFEALTDLFDALISLTSACT